MYTRSHYGNLLLKLDADKSFGFDNCAKLWGRGGDSIHLGFEISSCVQQENCHLRTRECVSD